MWNYDFAFKWAGNRRGTRLKKYIPRISGRKLYWQHEPFDWNKVKESRSDRNNTIRPINPCKKGAGVGNPDYHFAFDVYFERLTQIELDRLIAVLQLGLDDKDDKKTGCHSIGHGKPFGMGSAKIVIDKVSIRKLSLSTEGSIVRSFKEDDGLKKSRPLDQVFGNKHYVRQVMAICAVHEFDESEYPIIYPVPEDGNESYKWFVYNRGANNTPKIKKTLPEIPDDANSLSAKNLAERMALVKNSKN